MQLNVEYVYLQKLAIFLFMYCILDASEESRPLLRVHPFIGSRQLDRHSAAGGPLKRGFGLSGAVLQLDRNPRAAFVCSCRRATDLLGLAE